MLWAIAVGSAAGGVARYLLSGVMQRAAGSTFPWGTLLINVTGSLVLGFLMRYIVEGAGVGPGTRAMLTTGFLGGYTTFSTFSFETVSLLQQGNTRRAALYVVLSVGLALAGTFAGVAAAQRLLDRQDARSMAPSMEGE